MTISHSQLRAFHAVATHGSFSAAARAMHVTQPTLSGQVKDMEERYTVRLFERTGRGVELTDLGRSLLEHTRQLFAFESNIEHLLGSARQLARGELRVGADSPYLVTPILATFGRSYPGIRLSLSFGNTQELNRLLISKKIDVALLPITDDDNRLTVIPLKPDRLVAFVARTHPWAGRREIRLSELADQRLILREPGSTTRAILERAARSAKLRLSDVMEVGSREGAREAVAAGLGVGIVPETERGNDGRLYFLQVRDALLENREAVAVLKSTRNNPAIHAFTQTVLESAFVNLDTSAT